MFCGSVYQDADWNASRLCLVRESVTKYLFLYAPYFTSDSGPDRSLLIAAFLKVAYLIYALDVDRGSWCAHQPAKGAILITLTPVFCRGLVERQPIAIPDCSSNVPMNNLKGPLGAITRVNLKFVCVDINELLHSLLKQGGCFGQHGGGAFLTGKKKRIIATLELCGEGIQATFVEDNVAIGHPDPICLC